MRLGDVERALARLASPDSAGARRAATPNPERSGATMQLEPDNDKRNGRCEEPADNRPEILTQQTSDDGQELTVLFEVSHSGFADGSWLASDATIESGVWR